MPKQLEKEIEVEVKYQWIKGDNQGTVETYKSTDGKFFVFESGKRCNQEVIGEFMMKIDFENPVLQFEDPIGSVTAKPKNKKVSAEMKNFKEALIQSKMPAPSSPIVSLLEKAKTKKTKLNTRISMDLPSKEFIDVLQNSWDEDILTIQAEYIVSKIEDPQEFLIEKIKVALSEWFHTTPKTKIRPKK